MPEGLDEGEGIPVTAGINCEPPHSQFVIRMGVVARENASSAGLSPDRLKTAPR
jgi:hypothetical protein